MMSRLSLSEVSSAPRVQRRQALLCIPVTCRHQLGSTRSYSAWIGAAQWRITGNPSEQGPSGAHRRCAKLGPGHDRPRCPSSSNEGCGRPGGKGGWGEGVPDEFLREAHVVLGHVVSEPLRPAIHAVSELRGSVVALAEPAEG